MKHLSLSLSFTIGQKIFFGVVLLLTILVLVVNANVKIENANYYEDEDWEIVSNYIEQEYGKIYHEINIIDSIKLLFISPTEEMPFQKIVTLGAGEYCMKVPEENEEFVAHRAEYVIYLPKDWNHEFNNRKSTWPLVLLGAMAHFPREAAENWLGVGHTVEMYEDSSPIKGSKSFNSCLFLDAKDKDGNVIMPVKLKSPGREVAFLQIYPLYPEEYNYVAEHSYSALLNIIGDQLDYVINEDRPNYCK